MQGDIYMYKRLSFVGEVKGGYNDNLVGGLLETPPVTIARFVQLPKLGLCSNYKED